MASLHDALHSLKPTTWDSVPKAPDELREYVRDLFKNSRLVAESLPDPPPYEETNTVPDTNSLHVVPSPARVAETDPDILPLQKQWGKPIKMGGPKDNPLGVHVWKVSADDGGGSWFGRRSVHEGMSFTRWQEKMSSEYDETLKVNRKKIEKGQTPDSSIRGIGAEEKVETVEVKDEDGSIMAQMMVYHVSAQFPKPTAPRDFVALIVTSDSGLRIGGTKQPGRSWMMVSKPCDHPDVPAKQGYTRGEYESVELIREIPRKGRSGTNSSSGSISGATKGGSSDTNGQSGSEAQGYDEESNPVEWIMITRSDPGGSIPRWMVDKGTPRSVGADAAKFVDWAIQEEKPKGQEGPPQDASKDADVPSSNPGTSTNDADCDEDDEEDQLDSDLESDLTDSEVIHHGLIASVAGLINSSLERYAPQAVYDYIPHGQRPPRSIPTDKSTIKSSKSSGTMDYEDAHSIPEKDHDETSLASARSAAATPIVEEVIHNNVTPAELMEKNKNGKLTSHEKDLAKLALRKRGIESKLDKVRSELESFQIATQSAPMTPTKGLNDFDSDMLKRAVENRAATPNSSSGKHSKPGSNSSETQVSSRTQAPTPEAAPHVQKATSQLFNEESKLLKQLRKVEVSQLKVASKIEARQRKDAERSEKTRSRSEVEGLRDEVKDLKKEVSKLRAERQKWVDLVTSLQAENAKLVAKDLKD